MTQKTIRSFGRRSWLHLEFAVKSLGFSDRMTEILVDEYNVEVILERHLEIRFEQTSRKAVGRLGGPVHQPLTQDFHRRHFYQDGDRFVAQVFLKINSSFHIHIEDHVLAFYPT